MSTVLQLGEDRVHQGIRVHNGAAGPLTVAQEQHVSAFYERSSHKCREGALGVTGAAAAGVHQRKSGYASRYTGVAQDLRLHGPHLVYEGLSQLYHLFQGMRLHDGVVDLHRRKIPPDGKLHHGLGPKWGPSLGRSPPEYRRRSSGWWTRNRRARL